MGGVQQATAGVDGQSSAAGGEAGMAPPLQRSVAGVVRAMDSHGARPALAHLLAAAGFVMEETAPGSGGR
eukprot:2416415-Alexandrium_andersonii.AAC.1